MDKPVISVVTVVRNDLAGLKSTIDSVAQASDLFEDFEHIIIDGDSTDGTREFLQSFRPDYRHRAISEPDAGIFDAMNKANRYVTGEYIYFLNAGDTLADAQTLREVSRMLGATAAAWGFGGIDYVNGQGAVIGSFTGQPYSRRKIELGLAYVPHQGAFVSRQLWSRLDGFDERFGLSSDQEFLLRCAAHKDPIEIPIIVARMLADGAHRSTTFEARAARYAAVRASHGRLLLRSQIVDRLYTVVIGKYWRLSHAVRERVLGRPRL